jgi:glycosyltransferase involved in cell wall biosynthesis
VHCANYGGMHLGPDAQDADVIELVSQTVTAARQLDAEIVHLHNLQIPYEHGLLLSLIRELHADGRKVVLTAYDVQDENFSISTVAGSIHGAGADKVLTVSHYTYGMLTSQGVSARIVPGCISDAVTRMAAHGTATCRRQRAGPLSVQAGAGGVIGAPGRLLSAKGQVDIIRAAAQANVRKVIVSNAQNSEPGYVELLRHETTSRGMILQFAEDAAELYSSVDLMVAAPRIPESQGLTPLEALALAVPAVVVMSGGLAEYSAIPGVSAVACQLFDCQPSTAGSECSPSLRYSEALATAIASVLGDLEAWRTLARVGRERILLTYSPWSIAALLEEIYCEVRA